MTLDKPVSKVLVLDDSRAHADAIKRFCDEHNLVGLTVRRSRLLKVLRSNIDRRDPAGRGLRRFGGRERDHRDADRCAAPRIADHPARESLASRDGLPEALARVACAAYVADDMTPLKRAIDEYLFGRDYPNALVRGISEITEARIDSLFPGMTIEHETPCIVRDQIIFGEVFSLIALESAWCRGYMLLQTSEQPLLDMIGGTREDGRAPDFRDVNSVLGELTNLVWGAFKNRYLGDAEALARHRAGAARRQSQAEVHFVRRRLPAALLQVPDDRSGIGALRVPRPALRVQPELVAGGFPRIGAGRGADGRIG